MDYVTRWIPASNSNKGKVMEKHLLNVENLAVEYVVNKEIVQAINGISFAWSCFYNQNETGVYYDDIVVANSYIGPFTQ